MHGWIRHYLELTNLEFKKKIILINLKSVNSELTLPGSNRRQKSYPM